MSTTEHRPAPAPQAIPRSERIPLHPLPAEPVFTDEWTGEVPVVAPHAPRARSGRPHRAQAGELAALAFALPLPIPAQRGPSEV